VAAARPEVLDHLSPTERYPCNGSLGRNSSRRRAAASQGPGKEQELTHGMV
jgi:hypothetical protein